MADAEYYKKETSLNSKNLRLGKGSLKNVMTVDVEDYFQVNAFSKVIRKEDWDQYPSTVERNTRRVLDIFENAKGGRPVKGTFFIVGWIAERYPGLVREIQERGHEIACHGYAHQVIFSQSKEQFKEDVRKAKSILEDIVGADVVGYRAPTYSITDKTLWALNILLELGFRYDSSLFPIAHDVYGFPQAPRFPFMIEFQNGRPSFGESFNDRFGTSESVSTSNESRSLGPGKNLIEFPISTFRFGNRNIPVSGGGYFRLFPYSLSEWLLKSINRRESKPFFFYLHPWEIDPDIPKIGNAGFLSKFRTYVNLGRTENRLEKLVSRFRFCTFAELL